MKKTDDKKDSDLGPSDAERKVVIGENYAFSATFRNTFSKHITKHITVIVLTCRPGKEN